MLKNKTVSKELNAEEWIDKLLLLASEVWSAEQYAECEETITRFLDVEMDNCPYCDGTGWDDNGVDGCGMCNGTGEILP